MEWSELFKKVSRKRLRLLLERFHGVCTSAFSTYVPPSSVFEAFFDAKLIEHTLRWCLILTTFCCVWGKFPNNELIFTCQVCALQLPRLYNN